MKIDESYFDKIAHLARLNFNEIEKKEMMSDMSKIISWVEKLEELDTENIEPLTSMSLEINVLREDQVSEHLNQSSAEMNAPEFRNGFFKVPKVIE